MPRVPIYNGPQVKPAAIGDLQQRVRADESQASNDSGLASLGRGLADLGDGLSAAEGRRAAQEEQARFLAAEREAERLEANLFDPEEGFLAFSGSEAVARREAALKDYEAGMETLQTGLGSPRLSGLWKEISAGRLAAARARVAEEGMKQTENWLQGERELRVEQRLSSAKANITKPERLSADLELLAFDAEIYARSQGLDDAQSDAFVQEQLGQVHQAALAHFIAAGQLDQAADYLEEQSETLSEPLAVALESSLAEERRLADGKARAEDLVTGAMAGAGEEGASAALDSALAEADRIEDGEMRGIVRRHVQALRQAAAAPEAVDPAQLEALDALKSEAYGAVQAGTNPDDLPSALRQGIGRADLERLRQRFEQGPAAEDDWARYASLSALPPEALALQDLFAESASLTPERFALLQHKQARARRALAAGPASPAAAALKAEQRRKEILIASMGLDTEGPEMGRLTASLDQALLEAEQAKGKPLESAEERRALQEGALAALPKTTAALKPLENPEELARLRQALPDQPEEALSALYRQLKQTGGL